MRKYMNFNVDLRTNAPVITVELITAIRICHLIMSTEH